MDASHKTRERGVPLFPVRHRDGGGSVAELRRQIAADRPRPWHVIFQVGGEDGPAVGASVQSVVMVGRSDSDSVIVPDLDLAPYEAQKHGISRRHAILLPTNEGLFLADLDSTNGTWLNGNRLASGQRCRLENGDRVEFGTLMTVLCVIGQIQTENSEEATCTVMREKPGETAPLGPRGADRITG